ncbi:MAG: DUF1016 domain-containing protein [Planctomycetes bacterium]|nr:DUF1016 domain-containing protein [Planctomycetota bacterium]
MPSKGLTHLRDRYDRLLTDTSGLLEQARRTAVRSVNAVLTSTCWQIGRRIVEHEQRGRKRAGYGELVVKRLSQDLTAKHGRGFSKRNLEQMRAFYLGWEIAQTPSAQFEARVICSTLSSESSPPPGIWPQARVTRAEMRRRKDRNGRVGLAPPVRLATWFLVGQAPPYILGDLADTVCQVRSQGKTPDGVGRIDFDRRS